MSHLCHPKNDTKFTNSRIENSRIQSRDGDPAIQSGTSLAEKCVFSPVQPDNYWAVSVEN